jgi:hypothetical protein
MTRAGVPPPSTLHRHQTENADSRCECAGISAPTLPLPTSAVGIAVGGADEQQDVVKDVISNCEISIGIPFAFSDGAVVSTVAEEE